MTPPCGVPFHEQSVDLPHRIRCGAFRPVAVRIGFQVCFEDRLDHQFDGGLHHPASYTTSWDAAEYIG